MSENTIRRTNHVMDYARCAFVDVPPGGSMGPSRGGYLGIGVDDYGHVVMGEVLVEADEPPRFAEASRWSGGPALTRVTPERLEPFLDGGRASKGMGSFVIAGPQSPQGQAQLRVRGDDLNAALHVLQKPAAWLQPGDAVLVHDIDAQLIAQPKEGTGRHSTQVQEAGRDAMKIDGQWFDVSTRHSLRTLQGDELKTAFSTTTIGGDHPYGDLDNEINAKLYLLTEEIEDWKTSGAAPSPQVTKYTDIARHHVLQTIDTESEHLSEPGHLHRSAQQLARRSNYLGGHLEAVQTISRAHQLAQQQQDTAPSSRRALTRRPPAPRAPRRSFVAPEQPVLQDEPSF